MPDGLPGLALRVKCRRAGRDPAGGVLPLAGDWLGKEDGDWTGLSGKLRSSAVGGWAVCAGAGGAPAARAINAAPSANPAMRAWGDTDEAPLKPPIPVRLIT